METAAAGNFTQWTDVSANHDALQTIGETFNEIVSQLETALLAVDPFTREVQTASKTVQNQTKEIATTVDATTGTTNKIDEHIATYLIDNLF